jgi:hypothetical protein
MSLTPPVVTCLFFTDSTVPAFLHSSAGRALAGDLLVECALHPSLSFVLNLETPPNYPGVAGLLGGADVGTLAHPTDLLPASIILAAGATVSPVAVRTALARLIHPDDHLRAITLLVPIAEARALGAALALADRYAIAWNATAFPHEELVEFARWLAAEHLLSADNFAGLYPYATSLVDAAHAQKIAALLVPFAARVPGFRAAIASVSS